jgi:hypothetical protein
MELCVDADDPDGIDGPEIRGRLINDVTDRFKSEELHDERVREMTPALDSHSRNSNEQVNINHQI